MKPLTHCLLLFITLLCLAASCKDDDMPPPPDPIDPDGLPLATQTGENTFGCLINGEPWIAEIDPNAITPTLRALEASYDEVDTGLFDWYAWDITAKFRNDNTSELIKFSSAPLHSPSVVNNTNSRYINSLILIDQGVNSLSLEIDTLLPFHIEITKLDTFNNIISGTFDFLAVSNDQTDTLHFTKGRFDAIYQPE